MYKITMNELFSGIGAQIAAMKRIGADCEVIGISDIDKYANQSYMAINGPTRQYGDICKIARLDYADLWTYSFPCQDLSVAGKQAGIAEGTRSGLLLEVERLLTTAVIEGTAPKFLLLENVKNLVGKKFKPDFDKWLQTLEALGYRNYWKVLNAKDYGVPQNRERVFVMSIRKDIECDYKFPEPVLLTKRLKDVLEPVVDEKYYISSKLLERLPYQLKLGTSTLDADIAGTQCARQYSNSNGAFVSEPLACASPGRNPDNPSNRSAGQYLEQRIEVNQTGCSNALTSVEKDNYVIEPSIMQEPINLYPNSGNPQAGRVYNTQGISPAMDTCQGGNRMPKIVEVSRNAKHQQDLIQHECGICRTIPAGTHASTPHLLKTMIDNYRIRKLTPRECWRLMGFTDTEFELAKASGVSNSQLYKEAGNSIVVDVLVAIFKSLFEGLK